MFNKSKTERFHINRNGESAWKKCKYLGSLFDNEKDIKRRKWLALDSFKTLKSILNGKYVSEQIRLRVLITYIESKFLYNSELLTLTKSQKESIDTFYRRLLRKVIHIRPRVISDKNLYEHTK